MPAKIATLVFILGIIALFYIERARDRAARVSPVLWGALLWICIGASRGLGQWFSSGPALENTDQLTEGSPLDRNVGTLLLILALAALVVRSRRFKGLLLKNWPLLLFLAYALFSTLWSDFPLVAVKRWTKTLGNLSMAMLVVTDASPLAAVRWILSRTAFILIPVSVLFVKYYPDLGRGYSIWDWIPYYQGVATGKNGLGIVCFVFGLGSLWCMLEAHSQKNGARRQLLVAHGSILVMTLWLFSKADSLTSFGCFIMGAVLLLALKYVGLAKRPILLHSITWGMILSAGSILFLDLGEMILRAMGRNPSLTGRTDIWAMAQSLVTNPIFGAGFESFWLGERLEYFWRAYYFRPNQAHNGYLETYLNLGWVGVVLLGLLVVWGYRNVIRSLEREPEMGNFKLTFFVVAILYNMTEAAFKVMHPVWIFFLLSIVIVPEVTLRNGNGNGSLRRFR